MMIESKIEWTLSTGISPEIGFPIVLKPKSAPTLEVGIEEG
jgi:hypothetical protein